jgi:hypothetical protein
MSKTVIALIVGILVGAVGSRLYTATPEATHTQQGEAEAEPTATLPDLPEPYYTVLFEDEAVRIVDHLLGTGETEPEHTHAPMLAYFVEGATVVITEEDGSTSEVTIPTGAFLGADNLRWWTHSLENTGDTPLHSILIELKRDPAGS